MLTTIIENTEEFYALEKEWKFLQEKDSKISYYSTYKYVKTWWDANKKDANKKLFIVCLYQGQDIVAIAPLFIENKTKLFISWNELKFIGKGDYFGFILDRSENNSLTLIKNIFNRIQEHSDKWDRLKLDYIKNDSSIAEYLLKSPYYNKYFKHLVEIPQFNIKKYTDFKEFEKNISRKVRKVKNKLNREVGYNFKAAKNIDDMLFKEITKIHTKQQVYINKQSSKKSRRTIFENERTKEFFENIIPNNSNVIVFLLESEEGSIISYSLAYLYNDILYSWNSAYDPEFSEYSLVDVRYYEMFQYLYENEIASIFDFGAGRYPWKFKWTSDFTSVYELEIYRKSSFKLKLLRLAQKLKEFIREVKT